MGTTTNQICFDDKKKKSTKIEEIRLLHEENNNIIKKSKTNKININIKKSLYQKNNSNTFSHDYNLKTQITNINNEKNIKNSKKENKKEDNYIKNYKILKKKKRNKSTDLPDINMYNENVFSNIKYKKGELKGKGRFSEIYMGLCTFTFEIITIKTFNHLSLDKKKLIIKNKDTLFKLNHPNIIKTISMYNEDNGDLSIVNDCPPLKNVEQIINNFGILDENLIQIYCKQLLKALQYLHRKKIYHKNLKLSNLLVDIDGTIKISDCLIDSLILGNEKEIYDNLLISNKIENYIPPFFIKYIINKYYNNEDNNNEENKINNLNEFEYWQSYDLWHLGCIIIQVSSKKKPWSNYNFKNNLELFYFLKDSNSIPDIPKALSIECQELIKILLNPSLTIKKNIYEILFNLNFFKINANNFDFQKTIENISNSVKINNSQKQYILNEDSNYLLNNSINNDSGNKLGNILEKNKVINILNSRNNPSFSISYTSQDFSLNGSNKVFSSFKSNLKNDYLNKNDTISFLNKIKTVKTIKSDMPEVKEEQFENSLIQ